MANSTGANFYSSFAHQLTFNQEPAFASGLAIFTEQLVCCSVRHSPHINKICSAYAIRAGFQLRWPCDSRAGPVHTLTPWPQSIGESFDVGKKT